MMIIEYFRTVELVSYLGPVLGTCEETSRGMYDRSYFKFAGAHFESQQSSKENASFFSGISQVPPFTLWQSIMSP